jgi:hypothetical protein
MNRFPCDSVPEIIVEGETGFMVEDIDRALEAVGKIEQIVVRAAATNSNKGSPIGTWPRTTSGFTSNCSAVHRLKRRPRIARE